MRRTLSSGRQLLAVDKVGCALLFVDPAGATFRRMAMPRGPHEIVLSPEKTQAYISIYGTGTFRENPNPGFEMERVNVSDGTAAGTVAIAPWTSPHGLAFDRFGVLWTTCDCHGVVLALSPEGEVLGHVETGSTGTHWVLAAPDGTKLFTSNKHDEFLSVIDPVERRVTNRIPVPNGTEGLAFSPDGRWLFAADHRVPQVLRIDGDRELVVESILLRGLVASATRASHHMRLCTSPDGTLLCVAAYHFDMLFLIEIDEPATQRVLPTGKGPMAMAFDPLEPRHLYLSNHDEGTISVIDVEQAEILRTFSCGEGIESMVFAPLI